MIGLLLFTIIIIIITWAVTLNYEERLMSQNNWRWGLCQSSGSRKLNLSPSSSKERETHSLLGPLERTSYPTE
jgi:hypothetical protein